MLLNFSFIHLVDTLAETLDLLAERIQQRFERFAVALLELPALLIEYFVGQILERQPLLLFECGDLLGAAGPGSCSRSAFSSASSFSSACRCAELSAASRVSAISSALRVSASARSPRSVSAQRRAAGRWTNPATTRAPTASPTNKTKAYSMVVSVRFLPPE